MEVLAAKLEQALPGQARVERRGGGLLGRGEKHVRAVRVELGTASYQLAVDGGALEGFRERQVGGIAIKREPLDPDAWIAALTARSARGGRAQRAGAGRRWRSCCAEMSDPGDPSSAQQEQEQEQSLARIEAGGIPLSAERRLSELRDPRAQARAVRRGRSRRTYR